MIVAVHDEYTRRQYLQACLGAPGVGAFLACRLQRYAHAPLAGYRFFTCERGGTAALMVCGTTAYATVGFHADELSSLLCFSGVHRLFAQERFSPLPDFAAGEPLALMRAQAPGAGKPLPDGVTIEEQPALLAAARLALQGQEEADEQAVENLYSELCTGRTHGDSLTVGVAQHGRLAAVALAPALWQYQAAISGVFTLPSRRGLGLGSIAVSALTQAIAQRGHQAVLWCEPGTVPFYEANDYIQIGEIYQFIQKG